MNKMDNDRKISMIINLVTGLIMIITVLAAVFIYRENIYNLLFKNNEADNIYDVQEILNPTSDYISFSEYESSEEQEISTETPESETNPEDLANTENIEPTKSDLMRYMFDNAIEIPGSQNKIEPPPDGRSEELQYGAVPLSDTIPDPFEYFKNIVFLGDSVTSGFELYKIKIKFNDEIILEDVNVVAAKKYGAYYAIQPISKDSSHPLMNGNQALPEDIIAQKDVKNVFICLGLNDLTFAKTSDFVKYYSRLINNIKEKNPDKNIVIMSVTPLVSGQYHDKLNNDMIIEANNALLEFAKENNIYFIDYAAAIRDSKNCLPEDLSSDGYCHLTVDAYDMLVEYLLYHPIN